MSRGRAGPSWGALDGTKAKANAALSANRTVRPLETEVAAMVSQAEAAHAVEDALLGDERSDELPADLRDRPGRLVRLRTCVDRLRAEAHADAARQQEKVDARAAEKAIGKSKRGRKPKPAAEAVDEEARRT